MVDSGCLGGNRNAPGNPRDCDFRKVRFKDPNPTQLAALPSTVSHFNRARIQYADSQALIKKYSPFQLNASGWPEIPTLTANQCQNPTDALINQLAAKIKPELWNAGTRIWVSERGARRLKCTREMPALRYPPGMAGRNRYFQMGISYANAAAAHLFLAFGTTFLNNLAGSIDADEADAIAYVVQHGLVWDAVNPAQSSPIRQWRNALKLLKPRRKKAAEAEAAAPDQEILGLVAALDNEEWEEFEAMFPGE